MKKLTILSLLFSATLACKTTGQTPTPPADFAATGFENHVDLQWSPVSGAAAYKIYRSTDGAVFSVLKTVSKGTLALDWTADEGQNLTRFYKITAVSAGGAESPQSASVTATTAPMTDEQLLEMVQRTTFRFFWDFAHPVSGMARDRNNGNDNAVTSGGTGFGIMAIVVAAERGWITREAAVNQLVKITNFLKTADRFHGAWPHWMDGGTGKVIPFSTYDNGGDLVETAFLVQGLLTARQYFDENSPAETGLRATITQLWEGVEWDWYRRGGNVLYWHWSPNYGWQMNFAIRGFNETMITYQLAIASPTHPIPATTYSSGWMSGSYVNTASHFGYKLYCGPVRGGPLFFAHYSYLGFDPRNKKDAVCNYFVRNRNHTLINRQFCILNLENHKGYSAECWGLTASDNPWGYGAHDPQPANDNGTISPTAALSSMPYTPAESMDALRHFYRALGEKLWGVYGFYDAFNLDVNWFAPSFLAIDQGPIICMIENHRTGLLWDLFMKNPEIQPMLDATGFVPDVISTEEGADFFEKNGFAARVYPNPATDGGQVFFEIDCLKNQELTAEIADAEGRVVRTFFSKKKFATGVWQERLERSGLPGGVYFLRLKSEDGQSYVLKMVF